MNRQLWALSFSLLTVVCHGATNYFTCPNGHYVHLGETLHQVIRTCGSPTSISKPKIPAGKTIHQMQWIYDYSLWNPSIGIQGRITPPVAKKNGLIVNFNPDYTVSSLYVENRPVQKTNYCNTSEIAVKSSNNISVYQLCGPPTTMHTVDNYVQNDTVPQVIAIYQKPYTPSEKLIFEKGILVEIHPQ